MIRNLLATTAIATLLATGAFAQDATTPAPADPAVPADPAAPVTEDAAPVVRADGHLASQVMGQTVYNSPADDAQQIGKVNDIVIGSDGNIQAVVIGVGGFLGIGEKNVTFDYADLEWAERDGSRWLIAPTTKEQLEQQAAFDAEAYEPAPAPAGTTEAPAAGDTMTQTQDTAPAAPVPAAPAPDATADTGTTDTTTDMGATDTETTAAVDRSTLTEMPASDIRAEEMIGTTVYGADDANVGQIGDVVLTDDGQVDAYIVDVGGFLGIGAKEVAVGSDNLAFMTDADGNKYLYTDFSKEQLEAAAAYDAETFADQRDDQRILVP